MKNSIIALLLVFLASVSFAQEGNVENGEKIFKANCASCHKPDRKLIGPQIKGVKDKYEGDIDYIHAFVKNSQELIKSGDPRAVKVYEENGKQIMTNFDLTKQEVIDILAYADSFEKDESAGTGIKIRPIEPEPKSAMKPLYLKKNMGGWLMYFLAALLLLVVLNQLSLVQDLLPNKNKDENEELNS